MRVPILPFSAALALLAILTMMCLSPGILPLAFIFFFAPGFLLLLAANAFFWMGGALLAWTIAALLLRRLAVPPGDGHFGVDEHGFDQLRHRRGVDGRGAVEVDLADVALRPSRRRSRRKEEDGQIRQVLQRDCG